MLRVFFFYLTASLAASSFMRCSTYSMAECEVMDFALIALSGASSKRKLAICGIRSGSDGGNASLILVVAALTDHWSDYSTSESGMLGKDGAVPRYEPKRMPRQVADCRIASRFGGWWVVRRMDGRGAVAAKARGERRAGMREFHAVLLSCTDGCYCLTGFELQAL